MSEYVTDFQKFDPLHNIPLMLKIHRATSTISRETQWRAFKIVLLINDMIMAGAGFYIAYALRFALLKGVFNENVPLTPQFYQALVALLLPLWLVIYASVGLYQKRYLLGGTEEYARAFRATTLGVLAVIVFSFLDIVFVISRGWLSLSWPATFLMVAIGRFVLRRAVYFLRQWGYFLTPAVIIGGNQEGRWLAEQLSSWKTSGILLLGFVDEKVAPGTCLYGKLHSLGTVDQLDEIIERYDIGELILATSAISSRNKQLEIFKRYGVSSKVNVRMSSGLYEIITTGLTVSEFSYVPFVMINKARLTGVDEIMKLCLDYAITIPLIILFAPVFLTLAIMVKIDSPGPVIYRRRVMGMNGKSFDAFKFRTMRINGDEILEQNPALKAELAENHKLKVDPRITKIGAALRKYSLDELPQFFNVLRREMSLVGPRMITQEEVAKYNQWDINLLTVRPGISGLWQVSGRSDVSYEERVQMDMYYVRNWSIWLDLQIAFQTPLAIIKGKGAY